MGNMCKTKIRPDCTKILSSGSQKSSLGFGQNFLLRLSASFGAEEKWQLGHIIHVSPAPPSSSAVKRKFRAASWYP